MTVDIGVDGMESVALARQGIGKGADALRIDEIKYQTTSLLERFNGEIRSRERMGTVWTVHNLQALL